MKVFRIIGFAVSIFNIAVVTIAILTGYKDSPSWFYPCVLITSFANILFFLFRKK